VIRPGIPTAKISTLQFLFAEGLRQSVEKISRVQPEVKWPNDIVVNSKKLAGILIEAKSRGREIVYGIVGIGINANLNAKQLPKDATSLHIETGAIIDLETSLDTVLGTLSSYYEKLLDEESIISEWWAHCAHRMKPVLVKTTEGLVHGKCIGINPDGSLEVQTEKGTTLITDGTLRLET
jgi:BirA family biotin operon repressor/biotin-[acetyl-CoA-carboxylase] ligase